MDSLAYDLAYTKHNIGKFKKQITTGIIIEIASLPLYLIPTLIPVPKSPDPLDITKSHTKSEIQYYNEKLDRYSKDLDNYNTTNKMIYMGAGVVTLIGVIISIDSYKWLGRASIKPTNYGLSLTIDLDKSESESESRENGYGD